VDNQPLPLSLPATIMPDGLKKSDPLPQPDSLVKPLDYREQFKVS
jgi:hypothetical protein